MIATLPAPVGPKRLGRYELIRRLGAGGMAEVHLARASGLEGFQKLLVLKRILPHYSADPRFIGMFLAEARLAAILDHPNVVQVYDLGVDEGDYFFTMEFVYGENLQSILREAAAQPETFPVEYGVQICIDVAAGLHYAHERVGFGGEPLGIVHRDVSPSNVMVTYDGCAKVADFGIAKVTTRTDVTRAGMRKGKAPYMSPEQCRAEKVDRRSDVFALGIVLYESTTLTRLFEGENEFGIMHRIVNGDVPRPSSRRKHYPAALEQIVMKALCVAREGRYASARALQLDLQDFARRSRLDVARTALGEWMHHLFVPRPFPWGAVEPHRVASEVADATSISPSDVSSSPSRSAVVGLGTSAAASGPHMHMRASATVAVAVPPIAALERRDRRLRWGALAAAGAIGLSGTAVFVRRPIDSPRSEVSSAALPESVVASSIVAVPSVEPSRLDSARSGLGSVQEGAASTPTQASGEVGSLQGEGEPVPTESAVLERESTPRPTDTLSGEGESVLTESTAVAGESALDRAARASEPAPGTKPRGPATQGAVGSLAGAELRRASASQSPAPNAEANHEKRKSSKAPPTSTRPRKSKPTDEDRSKAPSRGRQSPAASEAKSDPPGLDAFFPQ